MRLTPAGRHHNPVAVERVLDSLARGKPNAACGQLGAFANQGDALARSRRLAVEDAAALLATGDEVRDQLGCRPQRGGHHAEVRDRRAERR